VQEAGISEVGFWTQFVVACYARCQPLVIRVGSLWSGLEPGRKLHPSPRLAFVLPRFMAKTTVVTKKKRGPAPTGHGLQIGERWHPPEVKAIDAWIEAQGGNLTRGHAIRRLVALGLKVKK
jgi:hypothetical protein